MNRFWCARINGIAVRMALGVAVVLAAAGAGMAEELTPAPQAVQRPGVPVVATFSVLGDFVRAVGGDKVELTELVGPGADVHTYEPSPQDAARLAKASVIFETGLHFESWLDKLYVSSQSAARRIVTSEGVEPIAVVRGNVTETDPHIWQDVANAMVMVEQVRDGLIAADPANEAYYTARAEAYLARLGEINLDIIDMLKDIPDERRVLVTIHAPFAYFAKRYGFKVLGAGTESADGEMADPSAAGMARLADAMRAGGLHVVFTEQNANDKTAQAIAAEVNGQVAPPLYTDALGAAGSPGDTYINMMLYNAGVLARSLK